MILNPYENEPKKFPMYKQHGSFYATNIYNCKGYENFRIKKDILYIY